MKKIGKQILGFVLFLVFIYLVGLVHNMLQMVIPKLIIGSWRTYIILTLSFAIVDSVFILVMFGIGWIASHFHRHWIVKLLASIPCAVSFVSTEIQLWSFIDALYYAGFWEYLWGCVLTVLILIVYCALALSVIIAPYEE